MVKEVVKSVSETAKELSSHVRKNIGTAIVAAFAFIIALVWRDLIVETVNKIIEYLGLVGDGLVIHFIAALLTTLICVVGILYFSRWSEKKT